MENANAALDKIGQLQPAEVNFENTLRALDDVNYTISATENRFAIIKETSTNAALRDAATDQIKTLEEWAVGLDYREDVYRAVKAYADTRPKLEGEDAKLLEDTMRDYRRAGLDLPKAQRDEVEALRKKLSGLTTDFETNVTKPQHKPGLHQGRTGRRAGGFSGAKRRRPTTTALTPSWPTSPGITSP